MNPLRLVSFHVASGTWFAVQREAERLGLPASQLVRNAIDYLFVSGRMCPVDVVLSGGNRVRTDSVIVLPSNNGCL